MTAGNVDLVNKQLPEQAWINVFLNIEEKKGK
jgi:hypothetical protein